MDIRLIAIKNLRSGHHEIWRRIFNDFVCEGLLLGYGEQNSRLFEKLYEERKKGDKPDAYKSSEDSNPLTKADCYLNDIAFRIPKFIMFDKKESEKLVREYRREREKIKVFYSKKNFLDTTLTQINN